MAGVFETAIEILEKNGYEVAVLDKDIRLVTAYREDLSPHGVSGVLGFKGFDPGYICRGMKYRFHLHHHIDGEIRMCQNGMHYCMDLYDVLQWYYNINMKVTDCAIILDTELKNWRPIQKASWACEPTKRVTSDLFLLHGLSMNERAACLNASDAHHGGSIHFIIEPSGTKLRAEYKSTWISLQKI